MATRRRRRILVALEPAVLEGAFAALLKDGERSEVVQYHDGGATELANHYDAAIVTRGFGPEVESDLVITLPDTRTGGASEASLTISGETRPVNVGTKAQVIDLLTEWFPAEILGS